MDFKDAALFDPLTGDAVKAPVTDGKVWLSLKSGQSIILQTYDTAVQYVETESQPAAEPVTELVALPIEGQWSLTLDGGTPFKLEKPQTWETLSEEAASYMGTGTYEVSFNVTAQQIKTATAGFRLDLGDVRESARVSLNGIDMPCAWSVPFVLDCPGGAIREGENTLRIEVTNLPANRIRQMDRDGTEWRIFEDANIANISSATYTGWSLVPSGLNSKVRLIPMTYQNNALTAEMTGMVRRGDFYYPQFKLSAASSLTLKTQDGKVFTAYDIQPNDDGTAMLTVTGNANGRIVVEATGSEGKTAYAYVPAYGAYDMNTSIDLTADKEPLGGWQILTTTSEIKGFSAMGKLPWNRSKANGKNLNLYDGLTFTSEVSNYYFYFLGYGMNAPNDFTVTADNAALGAILAVSYLKGSGDDIYNAADSLLTFVLSEDADIPLSLPLKGNKSMTIYRSLCLYTPASAEVGIENVSVERDLQSPSTPYYTLQGIKIENRKSENRKLPRGLYIHGNRKIIVK